MSTVPWRHGRRWMYDRMVDEPRLTCGYSGDEPLPHPVLGEIRAALSQRYGRRFGGVFLNYYRDGHDSVAFHRDRELASSSEGLVAIVTLGTDAPVPVPAALAGGRSVDVRRGRATSS